MRSMMLMLAVCGLTLLPADAARAKPKAAKQAAMIIDANTGRVLHDDDGDEPRFPASLTKMMTLYMLFGEIEQGRMTYQSKIRISERANGMAPSKLGLEVGEEITVIDAVRALVVKSANDIAVAVAEHIGGTEYQFAQMMTQRAHQIGMRSTTFRNASGLPNPSQLSTARDMITLAIRLHDDYPQHYRNFSATSFTYGGKVYKSHNTLMLGFPGMDGVKTGYTRASGFNLVSSVRADGKHVVGAVFGGKTAATRNALMRSLMFAGLQQASKTKSREPNMLIASARRPAKLLATPPPQVEKVAAAALPKAPAAPRALASNVPLPVRALRPAAREPAPKRDAIAQVLAANKAPAGAPAAAAVASPAPAAVARLPDAPAAAPVDTTPQEAVAPPPRLDLEALRAAMSETESTEEPPPVRTAQASAAGPHDIASLIRNSIVEGEARPASSLNAQASALGASDVARDEEGSAGPVAVAAVQETPAARPAPIGKGFEIQIGAFGTADEAQSKIQSVRQRAVALLEGHDGVTLPFQQAERQYFRARFVNFDERSASSTCLELRRLAVDCLVMRAE